MTGYGVRRADVACCAGHAKNSGFRVRNKLSRKRVRRGAKKRARREGKVL